MLAGLGDFLRPPLSTDDSFEAVKGLSGHRPGNPAARVRTVIRYRSGNWTSLTGGGGIVISRATTALSILAALRGLDYDRLLGKVTPGTPGSFDDTGTGTSVAEFDEVLALVDEALGADRDPVDAILWNPVRGFFLKEGGGLNSKTPRILQIVPELMSTGGTVTIVGDNIGEFGTSNAVKFDQLEASVTGFASNSILVLVPGGARTGVLSVTNGYGMATASFRVVPEVDGGFTPRGDYSGVAGGATGSPVPGILGGFGPEGYDPVYTRVGQDSTRSQHPAPDISGDFSPKGGNTAASPPPDLPGGFEP